MLNPVQTLQKNSQAH